MGLLSVLGPLKAVPLAAKAPPFVAGLLVTAISINAQTHDWEPWKVALFFALLSGLSLPLGAAFGIYMTPLKDEEHEDDEETEEEIEAEEFRECIVACCLAFGAGALLFAVTVELYGEAMRELEHSGYTNGAVEILVMCAAAMGGAMLYTRLNRWLDAYLTQEEDMDIDVDRESLPLLRAQSTVHVRRKTTAVGGMVLSTRERSESAYGAAALQRQASGAPIRRSYSMSMSPSGSPSTCPTNRARKLATLTAIDAFTGSTDADTARKRQGSVHMACDQDLIVPARTDEEAPVASVSIKKKLEEEGDKKKSPLLVGMATWLGVFIDGLPEGVLLGFLAAERHLSIALVVSLFMANFPEAFSSASLLRQARKPIWAIMGMWTSLFVITAVLAAIAAFLFPPGDVPFHWKLLISFTEGLAGGAMLACIAAVMLPEAYQMQGDTIGLLAVAGFLTSVLVKVFGGVANEYSGDVDRAQHAALLLLHGHHAHAS